MKRGEVYDARLDPVEGSEQRGSRPVVVISRDAINESSPVVSAAPCTTYATNGSILSVVYLWSDADPAVTKIRLISARNASQTEIRYYQEGL